MISTVMDRRDRETIDRVEVLDTGELFVGIAGAGNPAYEFVYRMAAGVSWDPTMRGFKSTPMKEWSASRWFSHIVAVVHSEFGVALVPADAIAWRSLSEMDQSEIRQAALRAQ
jgi:hypothetical protein